MSKRRYKSEEFKNVDWERVEGRIEGERVVLAVDVAKEMGNLMATGLNVSPGAAIGVVALDADLAEARAHDLLGLLGLPLGIFNRRFYFRRYGDIHLRWG